MKGSFWLKLLYFVLIFTSPITSALGVSSPEDDSGYIALVDNIFIGDLIYPQGYKEFQLYLTPTFQNASGLKSMTFPVLGNYGITDALQFTAAWNAYEIQMPSDEPTTQGVGDIGFGLQYSFMNINKSTYSTSVGINVKISTASVSKNLSDGLNAYSPFFIVAKDFPSFYGSLFSSEFGLGFFSPESSASDAETANAFYWNLLFIVPYKTFRGIFELNWQTNEWDHGDDNELYFTPGLSWHPNLPIELGLGVPIGLTRSSDHYQIILLVTLTL